ncbi:MAG: type IV pilus assembly protein PilM [Candidatus Hydrogenedentota bacterium]
MVTLKPGRKRRLILDMGSSAIRLCEMSQTKTGFQLSKYYQVECNSDPALDEDARKRDRIKALESVLKEAKVRTKRTVFAVPGQSVFTRSRTLPPVPEFKVTQIVRYEIQQQIPFSLDQIAMDYQILERSEGGGYDVMMAAIKVDVVEKHLDVLRETKRSIDMVDVCPFAAYNWLKQCGEFGDGTGCVALVDMGAATTDIVIERDNQFRFTRPLNVGGNDVTLAIASAFGQNFSDAERVKRQRGFAPTGDPKVDGKGGEVIGEVLQRLITEINRSFAYFRSLPGGGAVNRVILCGGGACLRNIVPYMQKQLGIEVRIAQPLAGLAVLPQAEAANQNPEQACVVLGLALRCNKPVPIEINLIPPRILEAARRREQAFYWVLIFTAFALILASIIPIYAKENEVTRQKITNLRSVLEKYDPAYRDNAQRSFSQSQERQRLLAAQSNVQAPMDEQAKLSAIYNRRRAWLESLKLINDARPTAAGLWITQFETVEINQNDGGGGRGRGRGRARARGPAGGDRGQVRGFDSVEAPSGAASRSGAITRRQEPRRSRQGQSSEESGPMEHNIPAADGVRIRGYAREPEDIQAYVRSLRNATVQYPNGWYLWTADVMFKDGDVKRTSESVLWTGESAEPAEWERDIVYSFKITVNLEMGRQLPQGNNGGARGNNQS